MATSAAGRTTPTPSSCAPTTAPAVGRVSRSARRSPTTPPATASAGAPPGRSTIRLDWILSRGKEGLKVVDVRVDNLSMAITQRDEFTSVIQQNGGSIEKLIEFMQSKIRQIDQNA